VPSVKKAGVGLAADAEGTLSEPCEEALRHFEAFGADTKGCERKPRVKIEV
jgi:hypothetical protein